MNQALIRVLVSLLVSKGVLTQEDIDQGLENLQQQARDNLERDYPGITGWIESLFGDPDLDNIQLGDSSDET